MGASRPTEETPASTPIPQTRSNNTGHVRHEVSQVGLYKDHIQKVLKEFVLKLVQFRPKNGTYSKESPVLSFYRKISRLCHSKFEE